MTQVIYVGGGKGGVGKSLVSMATIDWLRSLGREVLLVEGDVANPDVYKCYEDLIPTQTCNFDVEDGWNDLGDLAERSEGKVIVVNSGARVIEGVRRYGHVLEDCSRAGVIDLVVLWPINRQRDSIGALKDFRSIVSAGQLGVIRNLFFGREEKFTRWQDSKYAQDLLQSGVRIANLDELSDRIIDRIYGSRMPIEKIANTGGVVDRSNIGHWRNRSQSSLASLIQ